MEILRQPSASIALETFVNSRPFWQSSSDQMLFGSLKKYMFRIPMRMVIMTLMSLFSTKPLDSSNIVLVQTLTNRVLLRLCVHFALYSVALCIGAGSMSQ
ncbi:hypothetical protein PILCRDRAFT_821400 [Piloderma croceum F 1598]|uniref:Uncharacterized protein n=1 Tax=Piloderma croceum (strain F 1598) TaxID=765440 RepID=A0A0C3FAK2_PILCF|nr:hypothetical protein PILCRDRAFT_821400 [Piloderma croceum F 1598]